jgi:dUTP pyrophosphatase
MSATAAATAYKLLLVVEPDAAEFPYKNIEERSNENAGFDLYTAEDFDAAGPALVSLGVRAMLTRLDTGEGVHYWLAPRSSIYKTGYVMANSLGVIDRSYRGVLKAPVVRVSGTGSLRRSERHFQIVAPDLGWIKEVEVVSELPATARGDGGFGSTGR